MKTVGVLTVHCSINAGASLQAYALCRTLGDLGCLPLLIDYRPPYFTDDMDEKKRKAKKPLKKRVAAILWRGKLMREHNAYLAFERDCLPKKTRRYDTLSDLVADPPRADAYLCGSDQIWNPRHVRRDGAMFFSFLPPGAGLSASFAASIGQDQLDGADLDFLGEHVARIDRVSVREESAARLLRDLLPGKTIERHIDPTLLLDAPAWRALESDAAEQVRGDYILYYPLADNPVTPALLQKAKETFGLPVVALSRRIGKEKGVDRQIRHFDPRDFLALIDHAAVVVTNSFHGSVFAVIFGKKLLSYKNPVRNSRLTDLFSLFSLPVRQIDTISDFDEACRPERLTPSPDTATLAKERERAMRYLRGIAGGDV